MPATSLHAASALTVAIALLACACPGAAAAQQSVAAWPDREFCGRAQSYVAGSTPRVTNTVHDGPESFARTPPAVQPLTTQQYDWPDDRAAPGAARQISCKFVTADRIRAVHGETSARSQASCEQLNRYTMQVVLAGLSPEERARALFDKGRKVRFERDQRARSADDWYVPYEMASVDSRGRLRIVARSWRVDWNDPKQASLAEDARGIQFCQLVAPAYLRRLLLDPSVVLPGPPPKQNR